MKMKDVTFETNSPQIKNNLGDSIIFPFGLPIFQTSVDEDFTDTLISVGRTLHETYNKELVSNFKYGNTYLFPREFIEETASPIILDRAIRFLDTYSQIYSLSNKKIYLDDLWINFSKRHDFNPSHNHAGLLSFVIYCKAPDTIFEDQAESKDPVAGLTVFEYGERTSEFNAGSFKVRPIEGMMMIFPSELRHFVGPYWAEEERITVSGNIHVAKD